MDEVIRRFNAQGVRYLVIGGQAVRLVNSWFWRTYDQKEIDFVEESGGQFQGYEFKWGGGRKGRPVAAFNALYPGSGFTFVDRDTIWTFAGVP